MRKIVRSKMCKVEMFVAQDGTEFDSEEACLEYEGNIERLETELHYIETCKKLKGFANFDGGENNEDHDYSWYRPKNQKEVDVLNEVFDIELEEDAIGEWVCVESSDGCWYSLLNDGIRYAQRVLERLGYKMEVKPIK